MPVVIGSARRRRQYVSVPSCRDICGDIYRSFSLELINIYLRVLKSVADFVNIKTQLISYLRRVNEWLNSQSNFKLIILYILFYDILLCNVIYLFALQIFIENRSLLLRALRLFCCTILMFFLCCSLCWHVKVIPILWKNNIILYIFSLLKVLGWWEICTP